MNLSDFLRYIYDDNNNTDNFHSLYLKPSGYWNPLCPAVGTVSSGGTLMMSVLVRTDRIWNCEDTAPAIVTVT